MGKGKKSVKGFRRESEHDDGLDEVLIRGKKNSKEKRFRESNEDNELAAFTENLEKFNPAVAIEKAGDEVAEASDLALQETQELMPDGATPAQEALIESGDERIKGLVAETHEQLDRLGQELDADSYNQVERQRLSNEYLDAFTNFLRTEMPGKDLTSEEVVSDLYVSAAQKAREKVEISDELEDVLSGKMAEILWQVQDELNPETSDENYEDDSENEGLEEKDKKSKQPQAGNNDFGALATLRDTLPQNVEPSTNNERALVKEKKPDAPETQTKSLEQEIQFRQAFTNQLMRELKISGMPRDEEILDNIYFRTRDKVFDDFNAKLPISSGRGYADPRKHADQELYPREYGIYVDKISRDRAVEIARDVREGVEAYLKNGVSTDKELFDKIDALSEADFLANPNELSAEILPQINTEKKEVKKESQTPEAPIDFSKIERGFAIIWRTPQSEERGTVVSISNKTILVGRKTEAGKAIRVPKISVVTVLNQYGDVIMGEGSKNATESVEQRAEKVLNYGDLSPQEQKKARIEFLKNFSRLVEQGFQDKNPLDDEQAKDVLLSADSQAQTLNTIPLTVRPLVLLRKPMVRVFNDIRNGNIPSSDEYFESIVDDTADMRTSLLNLAFGEKVGANEEAPSPPLDQNALDKLMAEAIGEDTGVDAQKEVKPAVESDALNLDEMFPAPKVVGATEVVGEGTTETNAKQEITPSDILNKIEEISFGVKFDIDNNVKKLEDSTKLQDLLDSFGIDLDTNSADDLSSKLKKLEILQSVLLEEFANKKTFDFTSFNDIYESRLVLEGGQTDSNDAAASSAEQGMDGVMTQDEIGAISAVVDEAKGEISQDLIEQNPLEGDQIEDVIEKMRTFSFTDAAGKEVELKVGDKLYLIIPDEKQIETYVIEDLDTDNGFYLSDGNWYELHSDYYSDIDDAEKNVAQLGVDAENNTPDHQPEFNLDSANSVADKIRIINDHIQKFTEEEKLAHKDSLKALGDITDKWMDLRQQLLHDITGIPAAELDLDLRELEEDINQIASLLAVDFPVKQSNENIDIPKLEESLSADEEARISEHAELLKVQEEFEKLSPEEQKKVSRGVRNIGFKIKEWKSETIASFFDGFASNKSSMGRFARALAQTYHHDAENARHLIELAEERKDAGSKFGLAKSGAMSSAITIGMVAKLGRTVYDSATIASGWGLVSPYRYAMMGAMGAARLGEAGKEARIATLASKNSKKFKKIDREALLHNWIEFQKEFQGSVEDKKQLAKNFRTLAVAADLKERLKGIKESQEGLSVIQNILSIDIPYTIGKIEKKLCDIDADSGLTPEQRAKEKIFVLQEYAKYIKELEYVVDAYGKVDAIARGFKYTEKLSKAFVIGMTVETLVLSADTLYDSMVALAKKSHELFDSIEHNLALRFDALNSEPVPVSDPVVSPLSHASVTNTSEVLTDPKPVVPETSPVVIPTPETVSTASVPTEITPTPSINPVEDFTKDHLLYKETGAEITNGANGVKVEYEIGGAKGDFATLDQALRRVVAQEISIDPNGKFNAVEATRAENVLANLRQLLEGKAVGDIKPTELDGIAQFKDGKLTILDYKKFDDFMDGKLFARATENIAEANVATGYSQTSASKWQEIFDQRGEKASIDFGSSADAKASEVVEPAASGATPTANPEVSPVATHVESLTPTEKVTTFNTTTDTLNGSSPTVDVASRPLQEVTINTASYPAEYMRDVLDKMTPDQASALAEAMTEAKIDADKWDGVNFIIEGNTDLLRNADGTFDPNQIELALELSKVQYPKPAELRLALEAMKVLNLEEAQETAIVKAITNPKEGAKALEKLFGDSSGNRGAKVTLNPRKGILHFENLGPQKLDGNMNFREGVLRIGKRAGAIFGGKFPLKNLVQAINSFK